MTAPLRIIGIAFRVVKSDPAGEQCDFQRKLRVAIVHKPNPTSKCCRGIAEVPWINPMREDYEPNDQGRRLTVAAAAVPAADRPVTNAATADQITAVIKLCDRHLYFHIGKTAGWLVENPLRQRLCVSDGEAIYAVVGIPSIQTVEKPSNSEERMK